MSAAADRAGVAAGVALRGSNTLARLRTIRLAIRVRGRASGHVRELDGGHTATSHPLPTLPVLPALLSCGLDAMGRKPGSPGWLLSGRSAILCATGCCVWSEHSARRVMRCRWFLRPACAVVERDGAFFLPGMSSETPLYVVRVRWGEEVVTKRLPDGAGQMPQGR